MYLQSQLIFCNLKHKSVLQASVNIASVQLTQGGGPAYINCLWDIYTVSVDQYTSGYNKTEMCMYSITTVEIRPES